MVRQIVVFLIFTGLSSRIFALEKNTALTLAEKAQANLYIQSAQLMTERKQAAARRSECAQESIFNSKKGRHRRNPAIFPQSRNSLLTQTGIVVREQPVVTGSLQESGSACCPEKVSEQ